MNIRTKADYPYRYRVRIGHGKVVHAAREDALRNPGWRVCVCGFDGIVGHDCTDLPPETPITCKMCRYEWEKMARAKPGARNGWRLTDEEIVWAQRPAGSISERNQLTCKAQTAALVAWLSDRAETLRYDHTAVVFDREFWDALKASVGL